MRVEIQGPSALYRLGTLMIKLDEFVKAEEVFETICKCTFDELKEGHFYYQIEQVKTNQQNYKKALEFYQDAFTIYLNHLSPDHPNIATCYNNIVLHSHFMKKAFEIFDNKLPSTHPLLVTSYNNIALVYTSMKKYPEAVTSYKRVVEIGPHVSPPRYQNLEVYKQNLESIRKKGNK
ncbi:unnamed protein product [Rotaria sordida]|uniref:Tetratricopeptide repeat protein n=1 Tax=Rotaria sordida TaxID=392033 RepID=A0A818TIS5_9BILA|nr:unnamed protein product [Rotaria sordida]CAF3685327.1 unnamed protein product [Rotaria sordida]